MAAAATERYKLELGASLRGGGDAGAVPLCALHHAFRPSGAAEGAVAVGAGGHAAVALASAAGAGAAPLVFKGRHVPAAPAGSTDCVLFLDPATGTARLERLAGGQITGLRMVHNQPPVCTTELAEKGEKKRSARRAALEDAEAKASKAPAQEASALAEWATADAAAFGTGAQLGAASPFGTDAAAEEEAAAAREFAREGESSDGRSSSSSSSDEDGGGEDGGGAAPTSRLAQH